MTDTNSDPPFSVDGKATVTENVEPPTRSLKFELQSLLNEHSRENRSNTPDFVLARFMLGCLDSFENAVSDRDYWYGFDPEAGTVEHIPEEE